MVTNHSMLMGCSAATSVEAGGFTETFVTFDGANDWLSRASDLTGAADSKTGLLFYSVRFTNTASADEYIIAFSDANSALRRLGTTGVIRTAWQNTSAAVTVGAFSGSEVVAAGERANGLLAIDADGTTRHYIWTDSNGAWTSDGSDASGGAVNIDWTRGVVTLCALNNGGGSKLSAGVARIALWTGIAVPDITNSGVRANFANASTGVLVDPATSVVAYGTPILDFYGAASVWNAGTNQGSGGNFTMNGAVV